MTRRPAAPRRARGLAPIAALLALAAPVAPAGAGAGAPATATRAAAAAAMKADATPAQGDRLESADCRGALATLNAQEAAVAATPRASAAPPAPVARPADKPYAITSCDAGGCWANDGSRLNRVGPSLWGPHGICTVQGTLVQCP